MIEAKQVEQLLANPEPGITLDELKNELNALAKLRDNARLAFCKRLAVAYMLIVGRRPVQGKSGGTSFYRWCAENIRAASGKAYPPGTLRTYVGVGFSNDPAGRIAIDAKRAAARSRTIWKLGAQVIKSVKQDDAPKPVSIVRLRTQYRLPTSVAQEVNGLMRVWEQASPEARAQFIYHVTGQRLKLAA